jgi:hypothetical protein
LLVEVAEDLLELVVLAVLVVEALEDLENHIQLCSGCYTASPLATPTGITVSATTYPITVGAGGGAPSCGPNDPGNGSNSVFSTITSAGGGAGGIMNQM